MLNLYGVRAFKIPTSPFIRGNSKTKAGLFMGFIIIYSAMAFLLFSCAKSKENYNPSEPARELFAQSQMELSNGEAEKAYHDYQKAVAIDPGIRDLSYLYDIIYDWVISESEQEDIPLLRAQKLVQLNPNQLKSRQELLSVSVDKERGIIYAFGIVIGSKDISQSSQRQFLASKSALADAQAWVARIARWSEDGIKCPFDISDSVTGVEKLKEGWISDTIYMIKIKAPIDCLG